MKTKQISRKIGLVTVQKNAYFWAISAFWGFSGTLLVSYIIKKPYGHHLILFLNTMALVTTLSMIGFSLLFLL